MINPNDPLPRLLIKLQANLQTLTERVDIIEPRESISGDPQFAEIFFDEEISGTFDVVTNNIGPANKVQIPYDANGESNGAIPDHTNDHITIARDGKYYVFCGFSARSANANTYEVVVYLNGGTVSTHIHTHRTTSTAGRIGAFSASCILDLSVGDTVETWIIRLDGPVAARTITFEHADFGLFKVGD